MTDKCRIISSNIGLGNVAAGGFLYSLDTLDNLKILRDDGAPAQVVILGNLEATKLSGNIVGEASGLANVNASNISMGTLQNARLPAVITSQFAGDGGGISGLNASNISTGTLQNARLPSSISVTSIAADGSALTNLSASNIAMGTLNTARLPSAIFVNSVTANFSGDGYGVSNISANNVSSGTLQNARLPSSITVANVTANLIGNAAGVFDMNASNISSGTLQNARLPSSITVANVTANLIGNAAGVFDMNASNISQGTLQNARLPSSITVANVSANGAGLTSLNASNLTTGTLDNARLPSSITVANVTANLTGNAAGVFDMNASNISSGTLNNSRLPSTITVANVTANLTGNGFNVYDLDADNIAFGTVHNSLLPQNISVNSVTANLIGAGAGISGVNASNISSGTLSNARLPASISVSNIAANGSALTSLNLANTYGSLLNTQLPSSISVSTVTANHVGDAFGISNVSASNIASGTLSNARLPSSISVSNIAANGSGLTSLNLANTYGSLLNTQLPTTIIGNLAGDAFGISNVSASNIASGTLSNARLPSSISVSNIAANGSGLTSLNLANTYGSVLNTQLPSSISVSNLSGNLAGDGFGISNVSASNISSGTLSNARLPSSISVSNIAANGSGLTSLNLANTYGSLLNTQLPTTITSNLAGDAFGISNVSASNIVSGTLSNLRLPSSISVSNIAANGSGLTSLNLANTYGSVLNTQLPSSISVATITANHVGDAFGISNVSASNIVSGTLSNARLPSSISVSNIAANGSGLTSLNLANTYGSVLNTQLPSSISVSSVSGNLGGDAFGISNVSASNIASGTLSNSRLPTTITANLAGDAFGISNVSASNIVSGTLSNARLPASISVSNIAANGSGLTSLNLANTYGSVLNTQLPSSISVGNLTATANITGSYIFGNGAYLTGVVTSGGGTSNASLLTEGTLQNARLPSSISVSNISANGSALTSLNLANTYGSVLNTQLPLTISVGNVTASGNVSGAYILGNGYYLTGITGGGGGGTTTDASLLTSGTLDNARLPALISVSNIVANGSGLTSLNLANTYGSVLNTQLPTTITANLAGDAYGISNVSASNIVSGTLSNSRLPASITVSNIAANGSGLTSLNLANTYGSVLNIQLPTTIIANLAGDAFGISNVSASNISSGTLSNSRLPSSISVSNIAANGSGLTSLNLANTYGSVLNTQLPSSISVSTVSANLTGDGFGISNVSASNIASGTLDNARLPSDISVTSITANGFALTEINAANIVGNIDANVILVGTLDVQNGGTGVTTSSGSGNVILSNDPTFQGLVTVNGNVNAQYVNANGSGLYGIVASNVVGLDNALQNVSANSVSANFLSGNGAGLTSIVLANTVGTLAENRLPANISGNGFGLSYLNSSNLTGVLSGVSNSTGIGGNVVFNVSPTFQGTVAAANVDALAFNSKELQLGTFTQSSVAPFSTHVTSAIAWSPALGIYCAAITSSSNSKLWATSSDGVTWTTTVDTFGGSSVYRYMLWVPELAKFAVLAFDYQTAHMGLSSNGTTWTYHAMPYDADYYNGWYWENFTWSPQLGLFAAVASVGYSNQRIATSPDGVTWTVCTTPDGGGVWYSNSFTDIVWSGMVFVVVSNNGPVKIMTSSDGVNWTQRTDPVDKPWTCIAYGNGVFIALSDSPAYVLRSLDGITWTAVSLTKTYWNRITYVPELKLFIAVRWPNSGDLVKIMSSRDGVSWTDYVSADIPFSVKYSNPILYFDVAWSSSLNTFLIVGGYYGSTNGWYVSMTPVLGIAAFLNGGSIVARDVSANTVSANTVSATQVLGQGFGLSNLNVANVTGILLDSSLSGVYSNVQTMRVLGNLRVGNLLIDSGNITSFTTNVQISEQLLVTNEGTGPAVKIRQNYTEAIFEAMDDANVTFKIYDGGYVAIGNGSANLGASPPTSALLSVVGNVSAESYSGNLDASYLTGVVNNARLPSSISVSNISANGSGLTSLNLANTYGSLLNTQLPATISANLAGDGFGISNVSASNIASGTLSNDRLPESITVSNISANGSISGNGAGLYGISLANTTGTLDTTRLPSDITISGNMSATSYTGNIDIGNLEIIFDSGGYFEANVGNITRPGYSFDMDTTTGFYSPQANTFAFVSGGAETAQIFPGGFAVNGSMTATSYYGNIDIGNVVLEIQDGGTFRANLGNTIEPSYAFVGDTSTGIYRPEPSKIGFVAGGVEKAQISTSGFIVNGNVSATYYTGNGSQLTGISSTPSLSIANVQITDSSYVVADDLAVSTTLGGFVIVNGNGFAPGSIVSVGTDLAIATVYVSTTQIRAQVPAKSSGSYSLSVIRGDTTTATLPLALTYSASPVWGTSSILSNVRQNVAFVTTLSATSDSNVVYSNASTLPPQTTLASNGTLSGNITSVADDTVYAFTIKATDVELQDTLRTFQMLYMLQFVITDIVAGSSQSFVIARKQAYGFGYNVYGQLGIIDTTRIAVNPIPTKGMDGSLAGKSILILATAFSGSFTIALATDGTLHSYGNNYYGQLGFAANISVDFPNIPTNITTRGSLNGKTAATIACGSNFAFVLATDGSLHSFGYNSVGQIGTTTNSGTETPNPTPMNISSNGSLSGKIVSKIACGSSHTVVLCTDGSLHTFGSNGSGQLGTTTNSGTGTPNPTPINITSNGTLAGKTITKIRCGGNFTFVICSDGSVHAFGNNYQGQLGSTTNNNSSTPNPTPFIPEGIASRLSGKTVSDIACGYGHTLVLATDGSLFSFGDNYYGALGTSTNLGTYTPNPTGFDITSNGSLSGKTISKIACGSYHTLVLCSDGSLHSFGWNYYGQLGTTTNNNTQTPISTPTLFTVSE